MTDKQIKLKQLMREQIDILHKSHNYTASRTIMAAEIEINELMWENEDLKSKNEALRKLVQMLWK